MGTILSSFRTARTSPYAAAEDDAFLHRELRLDVVDFEPVRSAPCHKPNGRMKALLHPKTPEATIARRGFLQTLAASSVALSLPPQPA